MLTNREVKIYRLCHHSFDGKTTTDTAVIMGLSVRRIQQILSDLENKHSQLFPILTQTQARDYHLYADEGWSAQEIADNTDRTRDAVHKSIASAVKKGMPDATNMCGTGKMARYDESMDSHVKEKF
ncbi:unnamed protein product [marine sediment metagenome]|uniref:Uncharacterized protein n=1 Tax=marine sediment metagenome TaxID=412755 RepID=X0UWR2_9ZZZZ